MSDSPTNIPSSTALSLTGLNEADMLALMKSWGQPSYRAKQLLEWVFLHRVTNFDEMTNLSRDLRERLKSETQLRSMFKAQVQGSADSTRKFLFRLHDRRFVESVLINASPALYGRAADRKTLCVSSQVGCAFDCKFCASGLAGFTRNLTADEIVEQVLLAEEESDKRIDNLVFMGMGEPLANLPNLLKAIEIINSPWGIGIGARHMTISTSGLAPQIRKLADQPLQLRLAVSLHGASDAVRSRIMPVNDRYPLDELFDSLHYFAERRKQRVTFEYILIEGVNDALEEARNLVQRAKSFSAKINLIPYNKVDGLPWERPSEDQQTAFLKVLTEAGVQATLRREKGHDIDAACGQLRLREEQALGELPS